MIAHQLPTTLREPLREIALLLRLAAVERDALHVLAQAHERVAEIRLHPLLAEVQRDQRAADQMRERRADGGVDDRDPDHVAGDGHAEERERAGQAPEDADEAEQRHDVREQAEAERQRALDEVAQILGDALVGVVGADGGCVGGQADAVVGAVAQPLVEKAPGHPAPPADLQPLVQVGPVHRDGDVDGGDPGEARHRARSRCGGTRTAAK